MRFVKKIISAFLIIALSNMLGCYSFVSINVDEYEQYEKKEGRSDEIYVKTKDNQWYRFTKYEFRIKNETLYGNGKVLLDSWQNAANSKIALSNIESMGVEEMNMYTTSILATLGVLSVIAVAVFFVWFGNEIVR